MKGEKTRNAKTWTEAKYWGGIRSALRRLYRFQWVPAQQALIGARERYEGPNRLQKWSFRCAVCDGRFLRKDVELDHKVPCGSLKELVDVGPFLERLFPEDAGAYQVICKPCHLVKTKEERRKRML
jgi:hypothetical protein